MKTLLKKIIKLIPIAFTKNQKYDRDTKKIIKKICTADSNCIDVGCHKGEILDWFIKFAPRGRHIGFEPIPEFYLALNGKYKNKATIYPIALSKIKGKTSFNYVKSNPAYSGIKKRQYVSHSEIIEEIQVEMDTLDNIIADNIDLIKINVEGGELNVLLGATNTIKKYQPVIIFEHGLGASEFYNTSPLDIYTFFASHNYRITTLQNWLSNDMYFSKQEFEDQFYKKLNYYFVAYSIPK